MNRNVVKIIAIALAVLMAASVITVALVALLPVYSKMLRRINTNIEVEGNSDMGKIDISGEDA